MRLESPVDNFKVSKISGIVIWRLYMKLDLFDINAFKKFQNSIFNSERSIVISKDIRMNTRTDMSTYIIVGRSFAGSLWIENLVQVFFLWPEYF